ncbi:hypothetical protein RYZ26_15560 [Terasakiella sp. A23]|uniref:COG4648 family protein n=1 Tax=Terasakiella sp. FCG-A23 TaxID=3080561 RepID=UPI0029541180|nr:hypothetical protein [Terasakiella sp. A23]MDV7341023.1 hypothetical protein [Terasakiella sp. A23]
MKPGVKVKPLVVLLTLLGLAYPFAVYFGLQVFSPLTIAFCLLGFLAIRLFVQWREKKQMIEMVALVLTLICVAVLMVVDQMLAVKSYPVALSLSLAAVFSYSVLHPPTFIERFARLLEPNLNEKGVRYTRKVTVVWIGFFIVNASISAGTALYGDLDVWTFYNGFLSYIFIGVVMGIELLVRQFVKKQHVGTAHD